MLRSELNSLFAKFKETHRLLLDFAAGHSEEGFELSRIQGEFATLKEELSGHTSLLTKEQSDYIEQAKSLLSTPRFKLQRIRSRSLSQSRSAPRSQTVPLDSLSSSTSSSRDHSFVSTSNNANSSVMSDKEAGKDAGGEEAAGKTSSDESDRRARLLEM